MKLEWRIVSPEEIADKEAHRCTSRRSRRSKIRCEMDVRDHELENCKFHTGRGELGQWFTWRMSPEELR